MGKVDVTLSSMHSTRKAFPNEPSPRSRICSYLLLKYVFSLFIIYLVYEINNIN
jgi:hypothetical protein